MSMKTRGVAFNIEDPAQKDLYDYTLKFKNFSAYIKGLIERDKAVRVPQKIINPPGAGGIKIKVGS